MNYNKPLLILILLLSITIVGEFYYLFFVQTAESKSITKQPDKVAEDKISSVPSPSPLPTTDPDQAFKEGLFDSLRVLKKGVIESSSLTYVLKGTIDKIDYRTEGNKRAIDVTIKASNGDTNRFRFPGTDLVSVKDSNNKKIDLFTIKQNDKVAITVQFDMIKIDYQSIVIQLL